MGPQKLEGRKWPGRRHSLETSAGLRGGGRTGPGRPPTEKAGTEAREWAGGTDREGLPGLKKKDPLPGAFWEPPQKSYNRRLISIPHAQ